MARLRDVKVDREQIRDAVLDLLGPYGVTRIAIFGSCARGEQTDESDLDILVRMEEPRRAPLGFRWFGIEHELSERLGRRVEIVTEECLSKYVRPYVQEDEIVLYDAAR